MFKLLLQINQAEGLGDVEELVQHVNNEWGVPCCVIAIRLCDMLALPVVLAMHNVEKSWHDDSHPNNWCNCSFFSMNASLVNKLFCCNCGFNGLQVTQNQGVLLCDNLLLDQIPLGLTLFSEMHASPMLMSYHLSLTCKQAI